MVFLNPENGIGNQKTANLVSAVIKDLGSPLLMFAYSWIGMLVKCGAVKPRKAMRIFGKVGWYPVKNYPNATLVTVINKIHKVFRAAISSSRCIITGDLISPRTIVGMSRNREEFYMGKSHFLHIFYELMGKLPIVKPAVVLFFNPYPRS